MARNLSYAYAFQEAFLDKWSGGPDVFEHWIWKRFPPRYLYWRGGLCNVPASNDDVRIANLLFAISRIPSLRRCHCCSYASKLPPLIVNHPPLSRPNTRVPTPPPTGACSTLAFYVHVVAFVFPVPSRSARHPHLASRSPLSFNHLIP